MKLPSVRELEDAWQVGYKEAKEYYNTNEHLNVPFVYKTVSGFPLGKWLAHERTIAKKNANSPTRPYSLTHKFLLDQIGMIWERQKADSWMQHYVVAQRYFAKHHNLDVPGSFVYEDVWLGDWLVRQRHARNAGTLSEERINLLDQLKFSWEDRYALQWDDFYRQAEKYYQDHGHLRISADHKRLKTWVTDQRDKYAQGKLSEDQIARLSSIGMHWEKRKR